jgi:hypothetical protein
VESIETLTAAHRGKGTRNRHCEVGKLSHFRDKVLVIVDEVTKRSWTELKRNLLILTAAFFVSVNQNFNIVAESLPEMDWTRKLSRAV